MTETVNIHEAKTHLSRLLELVQGGQEIILAKAGKPIARLVPLAPTETTRRSGRFGGHVGPEFFEPLPEEELALWEGRGSFVPPKRPRAPARRR
jgi:prevent-host-death family protein